MKPSDFIAAQLPILEEELKSRVSRSDPYGGRIWEAMAYSLMAGGKRIRPLMLQLSACAAAGCIREDVLRETLPFACAIEMIHTYSLIHDDLPAMDNDDYRRGRLTNHKVFGDAVAILAGDGLLNLAYETLFEALRQNPAPGRVRAASVIAAAAGPDGMVAGQTADILATFPENTVSDHLSDDPGAEAARLEYIERNKTGQMLAAALRAGAETQGASEEDCEALEHAGFLFGRAFQIEDDLLDIEGSQAELGKSIGKDASQNKLTFVSVYGVEEARRMVRELSGEAVRIFQRWDNEPARLLGAWIEQMIYRTK